MVRLRVNALNLDIKLYGYSSFHTRNGAIKSKMNMNNQVMKIVNSFHTRNGAIKRRILMYHLLKRLSSRFHTRNGAIKRLNGKNII